MTEPRRESPSPEVASGTESVLPGAHRGGFSRLPTAPIEALRVQVHEEPEPQPSVERIPVGIAGWALAFAIAGLVGSLFVGWAFPLGIAAGIIAVLALRQPWESRRIAVWALVLAGVSILYSAGWLVYAALSSAA